MTLEYSSTRSMLWRGYWRSLLRNRVHRTIWLAWMLGAFLTGFWISHSSGKSDPWAASAGLAASFCLAAFLAGYPQLRFKPQTRVLTLLADGLTTTIRGETKNYSWEDVARFEEDGGFLIIGLRNLNAFIVPPSAFQDSREREGLVEQGRSWWRAAAPRSVV
jgi:YcxB-like protein